MFLQSDIKDVLDNTRETNRELGGEYFKDSIPNLDDRMAYAGIWLPIFM